TLYLSHNNALGAGTGVDADGTTVQPDGLLVTNPGVVLGNEKIILNGGSIDVATAGPVEVRAVSTIGGTFDGPVSGAADLMLFDAPGTFNAVNPFEGAFLFNSSASQMTIGPSGSLVNAQVFIVDHGVLRVARPAGSDPGLHSVPLHSVHLTGGTLALA